MVSFDQNLFDILSENYQIRIVSTSYLGLEAGDIVVLNYPNVDRITNKRTNVTRFGFIMSSKNTEGHTGLQISTRLNPLLNFVDVSEINDSEFMDIIDKLYNEDLEPIFSNFTYVYNGSLDQVPIMDKFKTFKISEISGSSVLRVELGKIE